MSCYMLKRVMPVIRTKQTQLKPDIFTKFRDIQAHTPLTNPYQDLGSSRDLVQKYRLAIQ